jgi:glycosyltransferase involved in cell wall biosynthesis
MLTQRHAADASPTGNPSPVGASAAVPLKICIFARAFWPALGGLERITELVAAQMVSDGHIVEVLTDTPAEAGIPSPFAFVVTRTDRFSERLRAMRRADAILFMNVSLVGLLPALVSRKPTIASHHGVYRADHLRGRVLEAVKRFTTRFVPNISCSRYVARSIPGSSVVIPNAYDDKLFAVAPDAVRRSDFVFCGRLVSDKGVDVLIEAFAEVAQVVPDSTLTIVGSGPESARLKERAQRLGVGASIRFTGALRGASLVDKLREHRCLVVPSLWEEPFGIVALEGLACCDIVIASRRGGLPEAVGACGIVVEPTVEDLSAAMITVARARAAKTPLPGQPDDASRSAHLARHRPSLVGAAYLGVIAAAARP